MTTTHSDTQLKINYEYNIHQRIMLQLFRWCLDKVSSGGLSRLPRLRHLGTFGTLLGPLPKRLLYLSSDAPQILTVLSSLPLARELASGLHVTALTSLKAFKSVKSACTKTIVLKQVRGKFWETYPECPLRVNTHWPVLVFQILIVLSPLPLATLPSGLHATEDTLRLRWDASAHEAIRQWKKIRQN